MNVAIIGVGARGSIYARQFHSNGYKIVALCEKNQAILHSTAKKYALPVGLTGFGIGGGLMLADKIIPKSPWDPESNAQKQLTSILKKTNTQVDAKRRPKLLEALKPGSEFRSTLGKYQTWLDKNNYDTGSVFDEVAIGKDLINMMDRRGLLNKKYTHDLDIDAEIAAI